jgi:hypothetical protein
VVRVGLNDDRKRAAPIGFADHQPAAWDARVRVPRDVWPVAPDLLDLASRYAARRELRGRPRVDDQDRDDHARTVAMDRTCRSVLGNFSGALEQVCQGSQLVGNA